MWTVVVDVRESDEDTSTQFSTVPFRYTVTGLIVNLDISGKLS